MNPSDDDEVALSVPIYLLCRAAEDSALIRCSLDCVRRFPCQAVIVSALSRFPSSNVPDSHSFEFSTEQLLAQISLA